MPRIAQTPFASDTLGRAGAGASLPEFAVLSVMAKGQGGADRSRTDHAQLRPATHHAAKCLIRPHGTEMHQN